MTSNKCLFLKQEARTQTHRLFNRVGLKNHANGAPGRHLDYHHPQVASVRTFVEKCQETHNVCKLLVCNFDQVWTTQYNHSKRVWHKPFEKEGEHPNQHKPSVQKMIRSIRQALELEPPDQEEPGYTVQSVVLNAQANITPIEGWRFPRTTTTLSWADGELGSSWVTIRDGTAPEELVQQLNEELKGILEIHSQDSRTHMWNSSTMLHFLEFLSVQLRLKRMKHGLSLKDGKALVLCDKATVHARTAFEPLRKRWEVENHAIIVHGSTSDTVKVPPGWGAAGAPNDGFHQWYHLLRQSYQKVAASQGRFLELRKALSDLDLAVDGSVRYTTLGCVGYKKNKFRSYHHLVSPIRIAHRFSEHVDVGFCCIISTFCLNCIKIYR